MTTPAPLRRIVPVALMAAVFATFCDAVHVHTGTLTYTKPFLLGQSWSVLPSFFLVFVAMMLVYDRVFIMRAKAQDRSESASPGNLREAADSFLIFVLVYLMSGFGLGHEPLLNVVFYGAFLVRLRMTYERLFMATFALFLALAGMAGEGLLVVAGLVKYSHPDVFHVPFWLGGVYLHGALALREIMRALVYAGGQAHRR